MSRPRQQPRRRMRPFQPRPDRLETRRLLSGDGPPRHAWHDHGAAGDRAAEVETESHDGGWYSGHHDGWVGRSHADGSGWAWSDHGGSDHRDGGGDDSAEGPPPAGSSNDPTPATSPSPTPTPTPTPDSVPSSSAPSTVPSPSATPPSSSPATSGPKSAASDPVAVPASTPAAAAPAASKPPVAAAPAPAPAPAPAAAETADANGPTVLSADGDVDPAGEAHNSAAGGASGVVSDFDEDDVPVTSTPPAGFDAPGQAVAAGPADPVTLVGVALPAARATPRVGANATGEPSLTQGGADAAGADAAGAAVICGPEAVAGEPGVPESDPEGAAEAEVPLPGLLADFSPFDTEAVDRALERLSGSLAALDGGIARLGGARLVWPGLAAAALLLVGAEVVRRRAAGGPGEAAPRRHPAAWPGLPDGWAPES